MLIAKFEEDVDLEILIPSVLLHDIARVLESNDKTGDIDHAILGSEIGKERLKFMDEYFNRLKSEMDGLF